MPTARGWTVLAGGVATYAASLVFGAPVLTVLALAFLLGPPAAVAWVRLRRRGPLDVDVRLHPARPVEGLPWTCDVLISGRVPGGATLRLPLLGEEREAAVARTGRAGARAELRGVAGRRGRHSGGAGVLRLADPLGLAAAERSLPRTGDVVVWLRVPQGGDLDEHGAGGDGRRRGIRTRPVGFDLHGIREHRPGESLRRVDWKTTARTGELMVRELEDGSRLDVALVVDPGPHGGAATEAELDELLRAAAADAMALIRRGVRSALVVTGPATVRVALDAPGAETRAMDALAVAEAGRRLPLVEVLRTDPEVARAAAVRVRTADPGAAAALAARLGERVEVAS